MPICILIPEAGLYLHAILVLWGSAPTIIAVHLRRKLPLGWGLDFWTIYTGVLAIVVLFGSIILGRSMFGAGELVSASAVAVGIGGGVLALEADRYLVRSIMRRSGGRGAIGRIADPAARTRQGIPRRSGEEERIMISAGTALFLLIALFEELVFRGVLLALCMQLPSPLSWAAIVVSMLLFALSHTHFGLIHALAKVPLAIIVTGAMLLTGSIAAPIITHALFNAAIMARLKKWRTREADRPAVAPDRRGEP